MASCMSIAWIGLLRSAVTTLTLSLMVKAGLREKRTKGSNERSKIQKRNAEKCREKLGRADRDTLCNGPTLAGHLMHLAGAYASQNELVIVPPRIIHLLTN